MKVLSQIVPLFEGALLHGSSTVWNAPYPRRISGCATRTRYFSDTTAYLAANITWLWRYISSTSLKSCFLFSAVLERIIWKNDI